MEKAKEKSINLLKLLNNCKDKLHALYNLCVTNVLTAKNSNGELGEIYDEASTKQADLKGIMTALVTSHKDNRAQNGKASQGVVKQIKASLSNLEIRFYELYDSIVNDKSMEDSKALYKQYKGEVSSCCEAYKLMNENSKFADIEKGYRFIVRLLKSIIERIKKMFVSHDKEKEKAGVIGNNFRREINKSNTLVALLTA